MNKYLSVIFLYNRAGYRKILFLIGIIPISFLLIFLLKVGNPFNDHSIMLMERAFGGIWPVLIFIAVNLAGVMFVSTSLNGGRSLKSASATTGYTMRRLNLPPVSAYLTIFIYYLAVILIFWAVAIASLYAIGRIGLTITNAPDTNTGLALGLLRTEIGHALIPFAHPTIIIFNATCIFALASQCARSCYLTWHNGAPSTGILPVAVFMFLVWTNAIDNTYVIMGLAILVPYTIITFGDVISREKRPKGDPFKVNKYEGVLDMDSVDYEEDVYELEVNKPLGIDDLSPGEIPIRRKYGRDEDNGERRGIRKLAPGWMRRRFMPLGIDLNKVNYFFGACIGIGIAEHLVFYGKYMMKLNEIRRSIKGVTIDAGTKMPYFGELQEHTYYGYMVAILLVLFLQAYWNYQYYNKKTKSVYVMKRLPDQKEYRRTIWLSPIIQALIIVMIMVIHTVIDLCMYSLVTPQMALPVDHMSHILPF